MRKILVNAVGRFRAGDIFDPAQGQQPLIDAATSIGGAFVDETDLTRGVAEKAQAAYARGDADASSGIMLAQAAGGGAGGGDLVLFTGDGAPYSGLTFGRWSELIAYLAPLQAAQSGLKPRVRFTQSFAVPLADMPPTGWPMALAYLESVILNTGAVTVTLPPGVTLDMLSGITNGLGVTCDPSVDGETFKFSEFPPGMPWIFELSNGATITHGTSTKALVETPGDVIPTYFVLANVGATWLAPLNGPIVKANGSDVVIGSQIIGGYQGIPDGWATTTSPTAMLFYQDGISSSFPAVSWAGLIAEMFNGSDSLQLNQRHGTLAQRAALAALPGGYALKIGSTYFATDLGANGAPLWWNGAAWVDATGAIVP